MSEVARVELDELSARRLTNRIRDVLATLQERLDELVRLVEEAQSGDVHLALGYRSWTEYAEREFGDLRLRWPKDDRQELVSRLTDMGMSTRAIAPIAGVSKDTVHRDTSGVSNETPDSQTAQVDLESGESNVSPAQPRMVTGRDGKTYPVSPRPAKPQRRPRTDVKAVMGRVISRVMDAADASEQIKPAHLRTRKDEAARWARSLNDAIGTLQRLADLLEEEST